jgi:hypothetical protein
MGSSNSGFILKEILTNPSKAWETIDSEKKSIIAVRNGFLVPLLILISVSTIAGSLLFTNTKLSAAYSVLEGVRCFIVFYITVYASALLLKRITKQFNLTISFANSFRLIVYSLTPLLLCQIISRFFESLLFINILSFFGLYIFWTGLEKLINPPADRKAPLMLAAFISFIGIYIVSNFLLTRLFHKIYYGIFS